MRKPKIPSIWRFTHHSDLTFKVHEFSNPVDLAEGRDSIMTLLPVVTFATSCKSSGGAHLEEINFKTMSIRTY